MGLKNQFIILFVCAIFFAFIFPFSLTSTLPEPTTDLPVQNVVPKLVEISTTSPKPVITAEQYFIRGKTSFRIASSKKRTNSGKINMIMAMSTNFRPPWTFAFIASFREHHPDAIILLFVDISIEKNMHFIDPIVDKWDVDLIDFMSASVEASPTNFRWTVFKDWLSKADLADIQTIMFSDVDVYFQDNVFQHVHSPGIYVFEEAKDKYAKINEERWNKHWVGCAYGKDGLEMIGESTPLCSGTTIASAEYAFTYLEKLTHALDGISCTVKGVDQGVHNWLVYSGTFQSSGMPLTIVPNDFGWVATWASMEMDLEGVRELRTSDGRLWAAHHQYTREGTFVFHYLNRYGWNDFKAEHKNSDDE